MDRLPAKPQRVLARMVRGLEVGKNESWCDGEAVLDVGRIDECRFKLAIGEVSIIIWFAPDGHVYPLSAKPAHGGTIVAMELAESGRIHRWFRFRLREQVRMLQLWLARDWQQ